MMKKIFMISLLTGSALTAAAAGGFTIKGNIPGVPAGTVVELVEQEDGRNGRIAKIVADGGEFVLSGSVASPILCELRLRAEGYSLDKAFPMMVDNLDMTVSACAFDSLPDVFYVGSEGLEREMAVRVTGGKAQEEYEEYRKALFPYEAAVKDAHRRLYWSEEGKDPMKRDLLEKTFTDANVSLEKAESAFADAHPSYSISGLMYIRKMRDPFVYTGGELDALASAVDGMWDSARLSHVREAIEWSRQFPVKGRYTDFRVLDTEGRECALSECMDSGKYTLVDFWASWCGPCRAAIPHVRELYNKYPDKLKIFAVSMDSDEKAWRHAMEKEKMEWTQLWADKDHAEGVTKPYQIKGIPFMLLIDEEGNIAFSGHDPNALSDFLSRTLE